MDIKTCCVTGHRDIPEGQRIVLEVRLINAVLEAVSGGYSRFISGLAEGADMIFAEIVLEVRKTHPQIMLEGAISHEAALKRRDQVFRRLLEGCDRVQVLSPGYHPGVYQRRNRYMVDESQLVIAVYDGRETGGTYSTIKYAEKKGKQIQYLELERDKTTTV